MSILSDIDIARLCLKPSEFHDFFHKGKPTTDFTKTKEWGLDILEDPPMIEPFVPHQVRINENGEKIVSYGTSSYGYDLRCGNKFKIFTNVNSTVIDPKNFDDQAFVDFEGDVCIIPPNSFVLCASMEKISMPRDVTGIVLGKSTYARCGISCLATPLEAGWSGYVTLEFSNTTPLPAKLYAGEGCCQVLFFKGITACQISYGDRNGKYQNQTAGPVTAKV